MTQAWQHVRLAPDDVTGWESRIRGLADAFRTFATEVRALAATEHHAAQRQVTSAREDGRRRAAADSDQLDRALAEALRAARVTARRHSGALAGGLAGLPFNDPGWRRPDSLGKTMPGWLRVGFLGDTAPGPDPEIPVAVPLLPTTGWYVDGSGDPAAGLIRSAVLRLVAAAPARSVVVTCYDPRLARVLGAFDPLREHAPDVLGPSITDPEQLADELAQLVDVVAQRTTKLSRLGGLRFADLRAAGSRIPEPYRVVVLLDYPDGIDAAAQRELLRIAERATAGGVCFLVHHQRSTPPLHDVVPADLLSGLRRFVPVADRWDIEGLDEVRCRRDAPPAAQLCSELGALIGRRAAEARLPTLPLRDVLPPPADWLTRVGYGRHAELRADLGEDERGPAGLRLRSADPPLPNVLVGGAVGQGKSNLLLVLIHALAVRYAPHDLQMYLLDFKQGLEFAALGPAATRPHWLPHARVLGVYADREFGLAVLRHILAELELRAALFKRLGNVTDIAALPPSEPKRPPRILLVMDEFQVLLAADDDLAVEATELLEKLVRLGRAYGVHVVLATQTLEGIQRLAVKRDSIFGQVPYRVVLKTSEGDSQTLLANHNKAAAGLRFRGQAVLNDNFGSPEANRKIMVAYADGRELDRLRQELWRRTDSMPPSIFEQGEPADLARLMTAAGGSLTADADVTRAWLGLPLAVDPAPATLEVRPEPGAGLLVLGDDATTALGVLSGVAFTLAVAARQRRDRFTLIDLLPDDPAVHAGREALVALLRHTRCDVELVSRPDMPGALYGLRDEVRRRSGHEPPRHVFLLGAHRAVRLGAASGEEIDSPQDALQELARDGASVGVFLYGWWNRHRSCVDQLGYGNPIGAYLFLRHPIDGVREVCGANTTWSARPYRGLFYDGVADEPQQLVTFPPLSAADPALLGVPVAGRRA